MPNVPLALDFVKNEDDRKVMELFFVQKTVARPLVAPPGICRLSNSLRCATASSP